MISIKDLRKSYKGVEVLNIQNLEVPKGETFGLVGNNGAGKTTLFSCLLDLIKPDTGEVQVNGVAVNITEDWKKVMSAFIDESFLIGYLTPDEYFYFLGDLRSWHKAQVDDFLSQFDDLFNGEIRHKKKYIGDLSKGNQKKVGVVGALIGDPEIIVLDEPFANLDPTTQFKLKELIQSFAQDEAKTFLVSSHDLLHTTEVCERIVALDKGKVALDVRTNEETLERLKTFFSV